MHGRRAAPKNISRPPTKEETRAAELPIPVLATITDPSASRRSVRTRKIGVGTGKICGPPVYHTKVWCIGVVKKKWRISVRYNLPNNDARCRRLSPDCTITPMSYRTQTSPKVTPPAFRRQHENSPSETGHSRKGGRVASASAVYGRPRARSCAPQSARRRTDAQKKREVRAQLLVKHTADTGVARQL